MKELSSRARAGGEPAAVTDSPAVTAFVCVHCGRRGLPPSPGRPRVPHTPELPWPVPVEEVPVPCTGRLQPEHLLKAFESGADAVCIVACEADNCHYLEGSRRARRRVEYVRRILDDVGVGGDRLMIFHLPGSARQDMAQGAGGSGQDEAAAQEDSAARLRAIRDGLAAALASLGPSPLRASRDAPGRPAARAEGIRTEGLDGRAG